MRYAEAGFDLEIDLTRGSIDKVAADPSSTALYLGGQGAAEQILWERVPPDVEPTSPDNLLIFSAGLLAATPVPGANRTSISTFDAASGLYINSGLGGFFGPELKHAGYDKLIFSGKSDNLVYLWIDNDKVEIRDASHLQGKSALEAAALIRQELKDDKLQIAAIGLAGENRVHQSSIEHGNCSASQGVGAIMGDKRLKAIAIHGTKEIKVAEPEELFAACNRMYREIYDNPLCGDVLLTADDDPWLVNEFGGSNARGRIKGFWTEELQDEWEVHLETESVTYQWENYSQVLEEIRETVIDRSTCLRGTGCHNCPKGCHQVISLPDQRKYFLKNYSKLVYALAAHDNLEVNYELLAALQDYGLDELAALQTICFATDLYAAGIFTDADLPQFPTDGPARASYLIEKIVRRDGIGNALANGIPWAAHEMGGGAEAYDRSAKKMEQIPALQGVDNYAYLVMYATGEKTSITQIEGSFPKVPIPDKSERDLFVRNWEAAPERFKQWFGDWEPDQELSVEAAVNIADWNETMHYVDDALGVCPLLSSFRGQFGGRPPYHLHNLPWYISKATGLAIDSEDLWRIAARNRNLVRAMNVRRGLRRSDEKAPKDFFTLKSPDIEAKLLDAYYELKGWTAEGIPTRATLTRLGLDYVSEDLIMRGIAEVGT